MIVIYGFAAFLFFKIFPEFADMRSNTVIGAALMGLLSGVAMFAGEIAAKWRIGVWMQTERQDSVDQPSGVFLAFGLALAASILSTWLIAAGFSSQLYKSAFQSYRGDPIMFWVMAAIPPICHLAWWVPRFLQGISLARQARKD